MLSEYFVLWHPVCRCGSAEGLDAGRHCFRKWGFRRCEDICWIKTNKDPNRKYTLQQDTHACLVHTKVRALGSRGSAVRLLQVCQLRARQSGMLSASVRASVRHVLPVKTGSRGAGSGEHATSGASWNCALRAPAAMLMSKTFGGRKGSVADSQPPAVDDAGWQRCLF